VDATRVKGRVRKGHSKIVTIDPDAIKRCSPGDSSVVYAIQRVWIEMLVTSTMSFGMFF
jgi:hypothetical protein